MDAPLPRGDYFFEKLNPAAIFGRTKIPLVTGNDLFGMVSLLSRFADGRNSPVGNSPVTIVIFCGRRNFPMKKSFRNVKRLLAAGVVFTANKIPRRGIFLKK